jgi:DNA-binding transcriptional LysR family regulator
MHRIDFDPIDKMGYMMQLHRLEGFHWVAKTGGYARAARAFPYPITQPAVHQQVKKLEAELGVQLFERVAKDRMQLTPAGRQLHGFVSPFFEGLPAVVRAIQATDYEGEIRIRAADMQLRDMMPAWVRRIRERCPGAEIHLGELGAPDVSALLSGEADLLVNHFPEVPDTIATKHIATLHGFVVVPRNHRLAKRKRAALTDLQGETIITFTPGLLAHHLQTRALAEHGVVLERTITAGTAAAILGLVEAGLGVSALATTDREGPRRRGVVALPVMRPKFALPVYAAWRRKGPPHPVLHAALETAPKP